MIPKREMYALYGGLVWMVLVIFLGHMWGLNLPQTALLITPGAISQITAYVWQSRRHTSEVNPEND